MKHEDLLITLFAASVFAVGCEQSEKPGTDSREATARQLDKVQTETKQAVQAMKEYTYAQKSAFVEEMQGQLAALNRDLDQLSANVEKSSDSAKAEAKPKLQALREQADKLNQQLDKAKSATESTWDDFKAGFRKGYDELKGGVQKARQWLSEKVAP
jgi:methyl-accepting chemotaxis protein